MTDMHPLRLATGSHEDGSGKGCAMNVVSWINGDTTITDFPDCSDYFLSRLAQKINDRICSHRDGDLLCVDCSQVALSYGLRTVGTAGKADRHVYVKLAERAAALAKESGARADAHAYAAARAAAHAHAHAADAARSVDADADVDAADYAYAAAYAAAAARAGARAAAARADADAFLATLFELGDAFLATLFELFELWFTLTETNPTPPTTATVQTAIRQMVETG